MTKYYSNTIRIASILTLIAFVSTQAAFGYEGYLRSEQLGEALGPSQKPASTPPEAEAGPVTADSAVDAKASAGGVNGIAKATSSSSELQTVKEEATAIKYFNPDIKSAYWRRVRVPVEDREGIREFNAEIASFSPADVTFNLWYDEKARNYNWSEYTYENPPRDETKQHMPRQGKTVAKMAEELRDEPWFFISNCSQAQWMFRNGFLIINGELIKRPGDMLVVLENQIARPLRGEYTVFDLDRACLVRIYIDSKTNTIDLKGVKNGVPGPAILQNWQYSPPKQAGYDGSPKNDEVFFNHQAIKAAWSAMGTRGDGSVVFVHAFEDIYLKDFVKALRRAALRDVILLGGSADVQSAKKDAESKTGYKVDAARKRQSEQSFRDPEYPRTLGQMVVVMPHAATTATAGEASSAGGMNGGVGASAIGRQPDDLPSRLERLAQIERNQPEKTLRAALHALKRPEDSLTSVSRGMIVELLSQHKQLVPLEPCDLNHIKTPWGPINLTRLNDLDNYQDEHALAELARDLELVHCLGIINISTMRRGLGCLGLHGILKKYIPKTFSVVNSVVTTSWIVWASLIIDSRALAEQGIWTSPDGKTTITYEATTSGPVFTVNGEPVSDPADAEIAFLLAHPDVTHFDNAFTALPSDLKNTPSTEGLFRWPMLGMTREGAITETSAGGMNGGLAALVNALEEARKYNLPKLIIVVGDKELFNQLKQKKGAMIQYAENKQTAEDIESKYKGSYFIIIINKINSTFYMSNLPAAVTLTEEVRQVVDDFLRDV